MTYFRKFCLFALTIYAGNLHGQESLERSSSTQTQLPSTEPHAKDPLHSTALTDSQQLKSIVEGQLQAIRSFDPSRAYYAYTSKEFRKTTPLEDFKRFIKKYPVLYMNKSVKIEDISFKEGQIGICKAKLISKDGEIRPVEYIFIQEEGHWVILSIKITI